MDPVIPVDPPFILYKGEQLLDCSSCNFLGLAHHPEVKKGAIKYTLKYGVSAPSPAICSIPQQQLQEKLASLLGMEAAVLFPSFEEAKSSLLKLYHPHFLSSDTDNLDAIDVSKYSSICVDDSYTIGLYGTRGLGSAAHRRGVDFILGSLALGVGCSGAFIASSKKSAGPLSPSETLPFATLGALDAALSLIPEMDSERQVVQSHHQWLNSLATQKLKSPRLFLQFSSEDEAKEARQLLLKEKIFVTPPASHNLYIALTALHSPEDVFQLSSALRKLSATHLALAMQSLTPTP